MVAAKLATMQRGGDRKTDDFKASNDGLKVDAAAKAVALGIVPKRSPTAAEASGIEVVVV